MSVEILKKAREQRVEVGGFTFIVCRPTELEMAEVRSGLPAGDASHLALFRALVRFIVGWEGVALEDLADGAGPDRAEFTPETCMAWLTDRLDLLGPLVQAIVEMVNKRREVMEGRRKN